jgi:hypothetical protein
LRRMPFPFTLPTTGFVDFGVSFSSNTHPSLIQAATRTRAQLRHVLKTHKRLDPGEQQSNLNAVLEALDGYLPYLASIESSLSSKDVSGEHIDIVFLRESEFEWRPTLTGSGKSVSLAKSKGRWRQKGLDGELCFVLHTRAAVLTLMSREDLRPLLRTDVSPPEPEDRKQYVVAAMKHLTEAHACHKRAAEIGSSSDFASQGVAPDVSSMTQHALAAIALAEATLVAVLKDDPFPVAAAEESNTHSREWMYRTASVDTKRTRMLGLICVAAAGHATVAASSLRDVKDLDDDIKQYGENLVKVCRAKAARFQGISAESEGKAGEGLAWIQAAKSELGLKERSIKVLQNWKDKKETERIEKGKATWGSDAGKFEESRILDMIERKWTKVNDTVGTFSIETTDC